MQSLTQSFLARHRKKPNKNGFTMIELLVVVTIIVILTTIGLISYNQALQSGRNGRRKTDLETVRQALVLFRADTGHYSNAATYAGLSVDLVPDYISSLPADPQAASGEAYVYTRGCGATPSTCQSFTLSADLESNSGATVYSITNP